MNARQDEASPGELVWEVAVPALLGQAHLVEVLWLAEVNERSDFQVILVQWLDVL